MTKLSLDQGTLSSYLLDITLALRTAENSPGDLHLVGYCPRYLRSDVLELMKRCGDLAVKVTVERTNLDPAPLQFRLLCRLEAPLPFGFEPFSGEEYQSLATIIAEVHAQIA